MMVTDLMVVGGCWMLLHDKKWSRRRDKYHGCTVADEIGGFIQWHSLRMIRGCLQADFFSRRCAFSCVYRLFTPFWLICAIYYRFFASWRFFIPCSQLEPCIVLLPSCRMTDGTALDSRYEASKQTMSSCHTAAAAVSVENTWRKTTSTISPSLCYWLPCVQKASVSNESFAGSWTKLSCPLLSLSMFVIFSVLRLGPKQLCNCRTKHFVVKELGRK